VVATARNWPSRRWNHQASISGMAPERRHDIVPLALRALVSGTLASSMTGAVIGLLPVT